MFFRVIIAVGFVWEGEGQSCKTIEIIDVNSRASN